MKPEQQHCDQCLEIKPDLKEHCGEILCKKCRYFAENGEEENEDYDRGENIKNPSLNVFGENIHQKNGT
jgi:hypothetical protein